MSYLTHQTLTCPQCARSGQITWINSIGRGGAGTKLRKKRLYRVGPFRHDPSQTEILICPDCSAQVLPITSAPRKEAQDDT